MTKHNAHSRPAKSPSTSDPKTRGLRRHGKTLLAGLGSLAVAAGAAYVISGTPYMPTGTAYAKGGTAKPPPAGGPVPAIPIQPPVAPQMGVSATTALGFDITGFIQSATATCANPPGSTEGGSVTVNGIVIQVPTDTIVQFPANTLGWHDAVCPPAAPVAPPSKGGKPTPTPTPGVNG